MKKIKNSQLLLSHGNISAREKVLTLTDKVLDRLDSRERLKQMIKRTGDTLVIGDRRIDLNLYDNIYAFSSGKAGNHMARAFEDILGDRLTMGVAIVKIKDESDVYKKTQLFIGGHPLPNEEGIEGCKKMIEIAETMKDGDLLLMGLSGGCSSLMGYPVEGTTLEDLKEATDVMLKSGMWVMDINDIRGHLSRTARGRLGQHIKGGKVICFEIWDAVGLDDITDYSKPVPIMGMPVGYDTVSFEDIKKIIEKYHIAEKLPKNISSYLLDYDPSEETPKHPTCDADYYIVNTLPDSCSIALDVASEMGIEAHIMTTYAEGESKDFGIFMASLAREVVKNNRPFSAPCFIISAGETTTYIDNNDHIKGHGGPSQEMALSFAMAAKDLKEACLLSIDSEGTDGTTPAAGAITDGASLKAAEKEELNLKSSLMDHASYEALLSMGDVVITGNTGTNLCDFNVLYIDTQEERSQTK